VHAALEVSYIHPYTLSLSYTLCPNPKLQALAAAGHPVVHAALEVSYTLYPIPKLHPMP